MKNAVLYEIPLPHSINFEGNVSLIQSVTISALIAFVYAPAKPSLCLINRPNEVGAIENGLLGQPATAVERAREKLHP